MPALVGKTLLVFWDYVLFPGIIAAVFYFVIEYIKQKKGGKSYDEFIRKEVFGSSNLNEAAESRTPSNIPNGTSQEQQKMVPYKQQSFTDSEMTLRSRDFYELMAGRRSIRYFSDRPVPREVIDNIVRTAGTAPSGAHTEPWTFAVVSNPKLKSKLRAIVESEEEINYKQRMGDKWVNDLKKFNTNWVKPYLEVAPYIIVVFKQTHGYTDSGEKQINYYHEISVAIATGIMLAAIQNAGLVTLTSTPLNAGPAIRFLLDRPSNEKVLLLLPVGFPEHGTMVPDLQRKPLSHIMATCD